MMKQRRISAIAVLASVLFTATGTNEPWFSQNDSATTSSISPRFAGDDNNDGYITEDETGWDCATMGNRVCGPDYESDTGDYIAGYN